jgi:hypothetical protein
MYEFFTTKTQESKTCPGVKFTVRHITEAIRNKMRLALAGHLADLRDVQAELETQLTGPAAISTADDFAKFYKTRDRVDYITHIHLNPSWLDAGFVSLEGLLVDGQPFAGDARALCDMAPESLISEIVEAIQGVSELSPQERGNSELSTISAAVEGGQKSDTTAHPANNPDFTVPETA